MWRTGMWLVVGCWMWSSALAAEEQQQLTVDQLVPEHGIIRDPMSISYYPSRRERPPSSSPPSAATSSSTSVQPGGKTTTTVSDNEEASIRLPGSGSTKPTKYHYYPHNQHIYLLPECAVQQVCNAVYVRLNYTQPLCACPSRYREPCSASLNSDDLHTTELSIQPNGKPNQEEALKTAHELLEPVFDFPKLKKELKPNLLKLKTLLQAPGSPLLSGNGANPPLPTQSPIGAISYVDRLKQPQRNPIQVLTLVKTCEPVADMRLCRSPRDWSLLALQNIRTGKSHYLVICRCPETSILEGPMSHDQPTYASVPGIRVYGMMCVNKTYTPPPTPTSSKRRARPLRNSRSLRFWDTIVPFPWHKVKILMKQANL